MSGSQTPFARRSLGVLSRIAPDRRRRRTAVTLLGRDAAERRHERVAPSNTVSQLTLTKGSCSPAGVPDVSISGACIETPARPEIGTEVMLGKLRAQVMRHHAQGFGVQFIDIQNPAALRRYFG
jgi:hypothetical protein